MKLTLKIVFWMLLANVGLLAIDGYISVHERLQFVQQDSRKDTLLLGRTAQALLSDIRETSGERHAQQAIHDANSAEDLVRIRWIHPHGDATPEYRPAVDTSKLKPLDEGRSVSIRQDSEAGVPYTYTYFPISPKGRRPAGIELAESQLPSRVFARSAVRRVVLISSALILFSTIFIGFIGVRLVGRPLHTLTEKAARVGRGDLSGQVLLPGHNELANLAHAMNKMCDDLSESSKRLREETEGRLQALEALRHADRLKTVGRLAAGVAHEVGTPLTVIGGRAAMIAQEEGSSDDTRENAGIIRTQTERITTLIRQLLDFAGRRPPHRVATSVADLVRKTVQLLAPQAGKRSIELCLSIEEAPCRASIDPSQIQQVLMNIIMNAMQAMADSGTIQVAVGRDRAKRPGSEDAPSEYICISVEDSGGGICEEHIRHLFEPFFTTKQIGQGTGLGLPIAYGIVQEHGGWIDVKSQEGVGSRFTVYLPPQIDGGADNAGGIDVDDTALCLDRRPAK